jgi:hypothetical protein
MLQLKPLPALRFLRRIFTRQIQKDPVTSSINTTLGANFFHFELVSNSLQKWMITVKMAVENIS